TVEHEAQQRQQHDRHDQHESQGGPVLAQLVQNAGHGGPGQAQRHQAVSSCCTRARKASSRSSRPARALTWAGVPVANTVPSRIMIRYWHRSASSITCEETRIVVPARANSVNRCHSSARSNGSCPTVGSSKTSRSGSAKSAQAREARERCPPERV